MLLVIVLIAMLLHLQQSNAHVINHHKTFREIANRKEEEVNYLRVRLLLCWLCQLDLDYPSYSDSI